MLVRGKPYAVLHFANGFNRPVYDGETDDLNAFIKMFELQHGECILFSYSIYL